MKVGWLGFFSFFAVVESLQAAKCTHMNYRNQVKGFGKKSKISS